LRWLDYDTIDVPKRSIKERRNMKTQRHLGTTMEDSRRKAERIRTVIVELDCTVQLLDCHIAAGELEVQVFDPSNVKYPQHAKSLAVQRNNLNVTITALENELAAARATLPETSRFNTQTNVAS
jgi:hypothetical protein